MFDHFNILAPIYDRAMPFTRLELISKLAELPVEGKLLDAGGGTGRVSGALLSLTNSAYVVDLSKGMLKQARTKALSGILSPAEMLPFQKETFERIIMIDALHHVYSQSDTIHELWRVLKVGGIILVEEPDLRKWQVKILALVEKLLLMRSHFLSPPSVAKLFPAGANVVIKTEGFNAWIIVKKG